MAARKKKGARKKASARKGAARKGSRSRKSGRARKKSAARSRSSHPCWFAPPCRGPQSALIPAPIDAKRFAWELPTMRTVLVEQFCSCSACRMSRSSIACCD